MKNILKILISLGFISIISIAKPFSATEVKMTSPDIQLKSIDFLSRNQSRITNILRLMGILEKSMKGFEERKIITKLKIFFNNKYNISNSDLIPIRNNLNEILSDANKKR